MPSKKGILTSRAGTYIPEWAINTRSPAVFNATVLPPAFGPVMSIILFCSPISILIGTTSPLSKGCRAPIILSFLSSSSESITSGATDFVLIACMPFAKARSSLAITFNICPHSSDIYPIRSDKSLRMICSSLVSAERASRQRLPKSIADMGSTNTVAPLSDTS